jgi:hypothetical protein
MIDKEDKILLKRLFDFYSGFGQPLNTTHIKSNLWIKFLKQAGLVGEH